MATKWGNGEGTLSESSTSLRRKGFLDDAEFLLRWLNRVLLATSSNTMR
jgi:hypothetical protein